MSDLEKALSIINSFVKRIAEHTDSACGVSISSYCDYEVYVHNLPKRVDIEGELFSQYPHQRFERAEEADSFIGRVLGSSLNIEARIEQLRELRSDMRDELEELDEQITRLTNEKRNSD